MVESTVAIHNDMVHVPVPQYTLSAVRYDIWFGGASAIYEVFTVFVTSLKKTADCHRHHKVSLFFCRGWE